MRLIRHLPNGSYPSAAFLSTRGPAILFGKNDKGQQVPAVSNLFGTLDRSRFIFQGYAEQVKTLVELKTNPSKPSGTLFKYAHVALTALSALPVRVGAGAPISFGKAKISDLPQIGNWPLDGGRFVTMPQVYTEDADKPGIMASQFGDVPHTDGRKWII